VFAIWRLWRRKVDPIVESREEFLAYPQTSPEIYEWLPYHRDTVQGGSGPYGAAAEPAGARESLAP
jgi:hypothetical protein